jgi:hypothetical protein
MIKMYCTETNQAKNYFKPDWYIFVLCRVRIMVFNATFNNISVILWRSVLLPGKYHQPAASHWQTLSLMLYRAHLTMSGIRTHSFSAICTDCTSNCKTRYQTIATTTTCTLHNFKYRRKISMVIYPVVTVHHKPDS